MCRFLRMVTNFKKFVLLIILFFSSAHLNAELEKAWEIIDVKKDSFFFIDRESMVFNEDEKIARIWQLENFRSIKRLPPQSISTRVDYDCNNSKFRTFVQYYHTGVMSKGKLIVANLEGKYYWKPVLKDSLAARIFTITCEKPPVFVEVKSKDNDNVGDKKSEKKDFKETNDKKNSKETKEVKTDKN